MAVIGTLPKIKIVDVLVELNLNSNIIFWCALGSILVGTFVAINQPKVKRLLADSGITHMGMAVMTLGLFSKEHVKPTLVYIFIYGIGFLGVVLLMGFYENEKFYYLFDLSGLYQVNIIMAVSQSLYVLSAEEIPPLSGFLGRWWIIWNMFLNNYVVIIMFSIILSMVSTIYYLQITQLCYFQKSHSYVVWERVFSKCKETKIQDFYLGFIFYFVCFLIINPRSLIICTDHLPISYLENVYINFDGTFIKFLDLLRVWWKCRRIWINTLILYSSLTFIHIGGS